MGCTGWHCSVRGVTLLLLFEPQATVVVVVLVGLCSPGSVVIELDRNNIVGDSFAALRSLKVTVGVIFLRVRTFSHRFAFTAQKPDMQRVLEVHFKGEAGIDVGGLTKEWCLLFSRQLQLPHYKLFRQTPSKDGRLDVHPFVPASQRALFCMRLIGR